MRIAVLPQTLINQIAAGEVVVRMANVVKELVENSIDAGANRIEVIVSNEARDVEVRDDGYGMSRDDAELSLQRHATSKIRTVEDLFNLATRGFRGEALPSIASVSRMEIFTREASALSGTRVFVEGGRIQRIEAVGCPVGTRIVVRDLFYNTPARLKFLKNPVSEANAVFATLTRQALAQPAIGFRGDREGRTVIDLPAGQTLSERFTSLLGSSLSVPVLPVDFEREGVRVHGVIAHPSDARGDRRGQYFFVNERPFSSKQLGAALEQACKGYVLVGHFPLFCLFVTLPAGDVDFNVHPTKEEVRFRDERFIAGTVYHAVQQAFIGSPALIGEVKLGEEQSQPTGRSAAPPPGFMTSPEALVRHAFERKRALQEDVFGARLSALSVPLKPAEQTANPSAETQHALPQQTWPAPLERDAQATNAHARPALHADGSAVSAGPGEAPDPFFWSQPWTPEPLGQIANTYIAAAYGPDLLLIDQHAAHERLVYLQLKKQQRTVHSQPLLIPITLELNPMQSETLRTLLPEFARLGFEISEFGQRTWCVNSLPTDLPEFDPVPMILQLVDDFEEAKRMNALEDLRDRILIRTACHSAIRAGQHLGPETMKELIQQIRAEKLSLTCPHGRPTIVRLSKHELDKQFRRIVH